MHTCPNLNCIEQENIYYAIIVNSASDGKTSQEEWLANNFIEFELISDGKVDAYRLRISEYSV